MNFCKQLGMVLVLVCLTGTAFALKVTWEGGSGPMNPEIQDFIDDITDEIGGINDKPEKLIKGFANASVYSSHAATQRAFGDYKTLSVTLGAIVGIQIPSDAASIKKELENTDDLGKLLEDRGGDMALGLNVQGTFQFGLNSSFLVDGLYLGLRLGYANISDISGVSFKMFHIGPVAHFRLLKGMDVGVFKWRGITAGAGFLYQKTNLNIKYVVEDVETGDSSSNYTIAKPKLVFDMDIATCTIPVEVNTAIQLLWFLNLNAGIGADISFGKNVTTLGLRADVYNNFTHSNEGALVIKAGGKMNPKKFNPKIMGNLGLKFGPVIIDVPVAYYFGEDPGLNMGVTLGVVF